MKTRWSDTHGPDGPPETYFHGFYKGLQGYVFDTDKGWMWEVRPSAYKPKERRAGLPIKLATGRLIAHGGPCKYGSDAMREAGKWMDAYKSKPKGKRQHGEVQRTQH